MAGGGNFNSIAGAVLASVLGVMGIGIAASMLFHPNYPEKAGFAPDISALQTASGAGPTEPAGPPDFGRLYADAAALPALVTKGESLVGQCKACHTFEDGGPNRIGPNLHDVFGRPSATHTGFEYSEGMKGHNVTWSYLTLNDFLTSPGTVVRGTKMTFAGLRRADDRVAVIAYLRSISTHQEALPAPLPEAVATPAAAPGTTPAAAAGNPATTPAPAQAAPAPHT